MTKTVKDRWRELSKPGGSVSRGLILESCPTPQLNDPSWFPTGARVWEPAIDGNSPDKFDVVLFRDLSAKNLSDDGLASRTGPAPALTLLRGATTAIRRGVPILAHTSGRFAELKRPATSSVSPFDIDPSRLLALEELVYLLQVHCELPEPKFDTDATAIYLTPIERRLANALKTAGIPYRVQVRIDRFIVDFLIDDSLVVECDGEGWHDPATDEIRDSRLRELNYRVVRFTGRAIVHGSERCISRIREEREMSARRQLAAELKMTQAQQNAASHVDGPALVVAPAGSGKTRVIEERVRLLIAGGVDPARICVVSFTNAAVGEVKDRLLAHPDVMVRTLNSFANEIVVNTRGKLAIIQGHKDPRLPTPMTVLQQVSRSIGYEPPPRKGSWTTLADAIQNYRGSFILPKPGELGVSLERSEGESDDSFFTRSEQMFQRIHAGYEDHLRRRDLIDFNGQIIEAIRILLADFEVRLKISQDYDYWLIDEFQDLAPPKILLARLLASPSRNLMVVGDDDQIIYGFAGARPQTFSSLDRDWCDLTSIPLDQNFRSPHELVVKTRWLIERNQKRIPKDTTPFRDLDDTDCVFTQFDLHSLPGGETDQHDYASLAVDEFQRLRRTRKPDDFVFLFRTKVAAAPVEFLLEQRGIPFVPLAKTSLLTNPTSIWVIAWLRVINSPRATFEDWKTVLQRPTRYLTNATLTWLITTNDPYSRILEAIDTDCENVPGRSDRQTAKQLRDSLKEFQSTIDAARRFPDSLANQLKQLDLPGTLNKEHTEKISRPDGLSAKHQGDGRSTDPRTIYQIMALMAELAGTWQVLEHFIARAESDPDVDLDVNSEMPQDSDALQLLTIHQFKGRERPIVFVLGPEIDYMPDSRAHEPDEVEEERRIAYVAATRAKERLYFWCSDLYEKELTQRADGLTWTMYRQGIREVPKTTPQPQKSSAQSILRPVAVTERQPGLLERALKWLAKWV